MRSRMLAGAIVLVSTSACLWQPKFEEIDLGVGVRLNAVAGRGWYGEEFIAVGAEGTVVRDDGRVWQFGSGELRDVRREPSFEPEGPWSWFVVGDAGMIVVGQQPGDYGDIEWQVQTSGTTADLYGVVVTGLYDDDDAITVIAVGDEVVLVGESTVEPAIFDWVTLPAPAGGWGRLRDVEAGFDGAWAAGLGGRIWTGDPSSDWRAIDSGTEEDLVDIHANRICGTRGTIVTCDSEPCRAEHPGDFDFITCHYDGMIGTDRRIYQTWYGDLERLYRVRGWQPRAIDESFGMVLVGDGGHAAHWLANEPMAL